MTIFVWLPLNIPIYFVLPRFFQKVDQNKILCETLCQNNCIAPNKFLLSFTQEVHQRLERWSGVRSLVALHLLKCQLLFCNLIRTHTHKRYSSSEGFRQLSSWNFWSIKIVWLALNWMCILIFDNSPVMSMCT